MVKVTILQYRLFHYRVELFERMKALCNQRGIDLHLVVGQSFGKEKLKQDEGQIFWARKVKNLFFPVAEKKDLCWQPVPRDLHDSALLIFMQENRLLSNYYWIVRRKLGIGPKVAFWGHGKDFQTRAPGGLRERWKEKTIHWVDWWFAYTRITCDQLRIADFPITRTTCLNNAVDVRRLRSDWESVPDRLREKVLEECKLTERSFVGLFCGSMYSDKKFPLLVAACDVVAKKFPDFRLVVIGDGTERKWIEDAFASRPWATWVGVKRSVEKAAYFGMASVVLNPGLVGLHVLDAFSMGLPMITTLTAKHSPEIAYLEDGVNGMMTEETPEAYASAIESLIVRREMLADMSKHARQTAELYTVEKMAENFVSGIERALAPDLAPT